MPSIGMMIIHLFWLFFWPQKSGSAERNRRCHCDYLSYLHGRKKRFEVFSLRPPQGRRLYPAVENWASDVSLAAVSKSRSANGAQTKPKLSRGVYNAPQ